MKKTKSTLNRVSNHQLTPNGTTVDLGLALNCDVEHDPDSLLGNRFLCRGSGGLLVGQSAIGKSTFALQMACHLAAGKDFFGLRSSHGGPLKVLYVQSENDAFEIAEVIQSVTEHWSPRDIDLLKQHLVIEIIWNKLGREFGRWLRNATPLHHPDLVMVDPLMGYLGADVLSNEAVTNFMREYVNDVLKNPPAGCDRFGLIFVHHTGKPVTGGRKDERPTNASRMYNMMGASELVNWARFIMRLEAATEQGRFQFQIPKRGIRAGVSNQTDENEWCCVVRHTPPSPNSKKQILRWESVDLPKNPVEANISDAEVKMMPIKFNGQPDQILPTPPAE